jgi:hypothetical protein
VFWFFCVSERDTSAEQLTPQTVDTMFPSDSNYALYGWKKYVFAVIKRKKHECIFVWMIVVPAEKIKGRFVYVVFYCNNYLVHISLCCIISHYVILNEKV